MQNTLMHIMGQVNKSDVVVGLGADLSTIIGTDPKINK